MSHDGTRDLQGERFQEAVIRPPAPSESHLTPTATSPSIGSTIQSKSTDRATTALTLPNRRAVETTSGSSTFAKDIDITHNVIQSSGDPFVIEVVPDSRFYTFVFSEYVQRTYANIDFSSYSMVTPASLVGYLVYMVHAYIFLIDVYQSPNMSAYAEEVDTTHALRKLVSQMYESYVPPVVIEVLRTILPHRLDVRSKLEFFSSYGSVLFTYDAPRLLPPSMFLLAHNQLITQLRVNSAYRNWLAHDLISYGGKMYKVANFIGGLYQSQTANQTNSFVYRNWLARSLFRLADSATHRTHLRRPDILDFEYSIPHVNDATYNPYIHLLMLSPQHRSTTQNFLNSLSNFCRDELHSSSTLQGLLSERLSSITRTVIKGPTAPTWHTQDLVDLDPDGSIKSGNFKSFCEVAKFGLERPKNTGGIELPYPDPTDQIAKELYLVLENDKESAFTPTTADEELHTEGMNLLFDPYDDEPSAHYGTVISGKLIQNSNVDGQVLILPNPTDALVKTNSRYLDGAVSLSVIIPEFNGQNIYLYPRFPRSGRAQSMHSLLYNAAQVWIPFFRQAISAIPNLGSFSVNAGADGIIPTTNTVAVLNHQKVKGSGKQVLLWSSYRHRHGSERPTESTVFFYATLELLFGTRSSLMQTYNLHQLLSLN